MLVGRCQTKTSGGTRCSPRYDLSLVIRQSANLSLQNLQQSRGFGNNFRFPEGEASAGGAPSAPAGNAGFADDSQDDDLYA